MIATVKETFHGVDFSVVYEVGKAYDFDEERLASLVQRGLVEAPAVEEKEEKQTVAETEDAAAEEIKRTRSRKK